MSAPHRSSRDKQGRTAALVVAGAAAVWLALQWVGASFGIPVRFMFLIDLAAMAAMIWAILVAVRLWRTRQDNG